jgi:hypothetical protein
MSLPVIVVLTAGCGGTPAATTRATMPATTRFKPGIVALPHVAYDPSVVDQIARSASYSAWIDPEDEHVLDLAVWPSRLAAEHALRQYRAGGPKTYPDRSVLGTGFPYKVRKVERLKNVTLAWYRSPTKADESEVRHSLRFHTAQIPRGTYTTLWAIPGTDIEPDATAATVPARYSASLSGGAIGGALTVAIWPSVRAARDYIDYIGSYAPTHRIRNVTVDTAAGSGSAPISDADVRVIQGALH